MTTAAERELRRQQARLLAIDNKAAAELRRTYLVLYGRLQQRLADLLEVIAEAEIAETEMKVSWLVRQEQYTTLIGELEREVWAWSRQGAETIAAGQGQAVGLVDRHQGALTELAVPQLARAEIAARLISLSPGAINAYVGFAGNGKPLGRLLERIAPDTSKAAQDALAYGIGRGQSPRVVAREFRKVASIPLDRALTISRTEILRAYRTASSDWYKANADVIGGWTWVAELDKRTCVACAAMNGTQHTVDESQDAHVNCRCTQSPFTKSWKDLGFEEMDAFERSPGPSPEEAFGALDEASQRAIMGETRHNLYKAGEITLADNVKVVRSAEWGAAVQVRPLKEL